MSFSSDTKAEMSLVMPDKRCCMLAEITGILKTCGSLRFAGLNRVSYRLATENGAVARKIIKLMKEYFGIRIELQVSRNMMLKKKTFYEMIITEDMRCEEILRETGILKVRDGFNVIDYGIDENIVKKKCCKKAFLRGAFLGSGSLVNPLKGYHFEIVAGNAQLAADIIRIMNSLKLNAKETLRRDTSIVYLKDSEMIIDFLGLAGAHKALLEIEEIKINKEMINQTVCRINCDSANMNKTLEASEKHIAAINKIIEKRGIDWLPPKLKEVALLRLDAREVSIEELGSMLNPPLKKSGVNNRLRKIMEIASKL